MIVEELCLEAAPVLYRGTALRAAKRFAGGTHRTAEPEETLERIRPHLRTAGITRLADVTGLDRIGIPTVLAYRPNSPTLSNAAGKGFTLAAAMVSGAMEGMELHHAENPRLPALHRSYGALVAEGRAIPRHRLALTRDALFSENRREYWVEGWDLLSQQEALVPYDSVAMLTHPAQRPDFWMAFPCTSNGLASGNHLLEAACSALMEVIERDALACHRAAFLTRQHSYARVALETVEHALVQDLLARFEAAQVGVLLYDLTVDTEVPVYSATLYDRVNRHLGMYGGYGAHLDPGVAMVRALTEAAQSRLTYIAGSRDDYFRHDYLKHRMGDGEQEIRAMEAVPATVDARARVSEATDSFEGDTALLLEKLSAAGLEQVVLVDLTHEEVGIPVVRVVVPGLEGYPSHQHYMPGRRARVFAERARLAHKEH